MNFRTIAVFAMLLPVFCCHEKNQNDSKAVKEELRSRKPIHLTQAQIDERAYKIGDTLLDKCEAEFRRSIKSSGDSTCEIVFQRIADSIQHQYEAILTRIPFDPARLKTIKSAKEREVFDACLYNRETHQRIDPNLQKDGDKEFIFTRPLVITDEKCVSCHMHSRKPFLQGKLRDTLGILNIRLQKKKVVMSFID